MEKGIRVKDIIAGRHISGIFAVKAAAQAQARNGAPYWNVTLADASGSIEAKIWSPLCKEFAAIPAGSFVLAAGQTSMFRDKCQLVIDSMNILDESEKTGLALAEFMPASPYDIAAMYAQLREIMETELTHRPWRKLLDDIFADEPLREAFCMAPAAAGIHHAYAGGLLEHTLSVTGLCRLLADKYAELDRQTLIAGAILHDIGKIRELSSGLTRDYTQEGRLLGHIFLGLEMIEPYVAVAGLEPWLAEHLRHLVLSHHGQFEYGAARLPQTAEAFALHYADNMDAKMAQCRSLFTEADSRPAWSAWQSSLERAILLPQRTPAAPAVKNAEQPDESAATDADEPIFDCPEADAEPSAEDMAALYADPDFNAPPDGCRNSVSPSPAAGHAGRSNRRDNQCSLL